MTAAQTAPAIPMMQKDRVYIINRIKQLVSKRHINVSNPDQHYQPWLDLVDRRSPALIRSSNDDDFEHGIKEVLNELGSSHTAFFHVCHDKVPAPYSINATLRPVNTTTGARWMFLDVIEDGAAYRAGIRPGEFLFAIDSTPLIPPHVAKFRIGGRHRLDVVNHEGQNRHVVLEIPSNKTAKDRPPMIEPKSLSYRMLTRDVGFVRVATFPGAVGQQFARELNLAVQDLKTRSMRRLVVDMRGNIGGGLGSLRLMSYLCPGRLEIGYSLTRRRLRNGYQKENLTRIERIPERKSQLFMMAIRFGLIHRDRSIVLVTEGLGEQPFHGRIVLLVNEHTRSAAEMVASFAKEYHLATIVGTRTAGEVLGGANFKLRKGYRLRIPVAGWYTWEGHCIEGRGVEPDVSAENSPESLAVGIDTQLEKAKEVVQTL